MPIPAFIYQNIKKNRVLPMQKTTTSLNKTDLKAKKQSSTNNKEMQPNDDTLQRILQFAATYRAQPIAQNQFVEMFLN